MTQVIRSPAGASICLADFGPDDRYPVLFLHQSPGCRLIRDPAWETSWPH
jgi:hypothetical protein